jgi:RNA polymerase primary sigma factor
MKDFFIITFSNQTQGADFMKSIKIINSTTDQSSDSLTRYLKEIRKVDFLTPIEEFELIKRVRAGDLLALERLVKANLRFVVSVAKHYQYQGITLPDLISEGNLGLLKAAQRYDETRGFKFISYAVWWIRQSILQALDEHSRIVRLPRNKVNSLSKINEAFAQLEQEFEREPSIEELAYLLDVELTDVQSALGLKIKQVSIDAPLREDEVHSLADILKNPNAEPPDHQISNSESLRVEIDIILENLNSNQAEVIKMYYGLEGKEQMNLYEIGRKLNISSERVRQIKEAALTRIKKSGRYRFLKEYVRS